MPKLKSLNGKERYNFLLSLVGFLQNRGPVTLQEAADHFDLEPNYLRKAVTSINEARAEVSDFEEWFFLIDIDLLEEEGMLSLIENSLLIESAPRLSNRQASAIAAGLNYLAGLPDFKANEDLKNLQKILSLGSSRGINPMIEVRPGSAEAGAQTLREAILAGKQISCEYFNQRGELSNRVLEPLRLDPISDGWYLRAYCPIHQEVRNFKLDRMRAIKVLDQPLSETARSVGEIQDELYVAEASDVSVTIEVDPEAYRLLGEFEKVSEPKNVNSGSVRAEIKVGHLPNIGRLVARYGGAARVIAPPEAKELVRQYALKALGVLPEHSVKNED